MQMKHDALGDLAEEYGIDINKTKGLKKSYKMSLSEKEIKEMGLVILCFHIRDLV